MLDYARESLAFVVPMIMISPESFHVIPLASLCLHSLYLARDPRGLSLFPSVWTHAWWQSVTSPGLLWPALGRCGSRAGAVGSSAYAWRFEAEPTLWTPLARSCWSEVEHPGLAASLCLFSLVMPASKSQDPLLRACTRQATFSLKFKMLQCSQDQTKFKVLN